MPKQLNSEDILASLWAEYCRQTKRETGVSFSKRKFSAWLLREEGMDPSKSDEGAFCRWTKPNGRENWRIPIHRVENTIRRLGGSQQDLDSLMQARVRETAQSGRADIAATYLWSTDSTERNLLDEEERWLVEQFRAARKGYRSRVLIGGDFSSEHQLLLKAALNACVDREIEEEISQPKESGEPTKMPESVADRLKAYWREKALEEDAAIAKKRKRVLRDKSVYSALKAVVKKIKSSEG